MSTTVQRAVAALDVETAECDAKLQHLIDLDFFILDNSIRESTVGQLKSHTIENKKEIFKLAKSVGMPGIVVATFSSLHRVDDEFARWLIDTGEDFSRLWSFSDVVNQVVDGVPAVTPLPPGLEKNAQFGLYNTIFEVDLGDRSLGWDDTFTVEDMCSLLDTRIAFVRENINTDAKILINFRDLPTAITVAPARLLHVVEHFASMPDDSRIFGLVFEDPMGESMPYEMAAWTRAIRSVMNEGGWQSGRLLNHVHEKFELGMASTLECLQAGSDGVWASLCNEGAMMGHASSTVTLTNLARLGNTNVLKNDRAKLFRQAAIKTTELTTTRLPHPKQCVYGGRALDLVFGFAGTGFNLGDFFGERTVNRITTLASPEMIRDRLQFLFGDDEQFTEEIGEKMRDKMLEDLNSVPPRKEEYQSAPGLAMLFDRSGGQLTEAMSKKISELELTRVHHDAIIADIRALWDEYDAKEDEVGDDQLEFDSFYHGFLSPYFGCYRCDETRQAFAAIDMNNDGQVDWNELMLYVKWALREYPEMTTADETLDKAFSEGMIPGMRDAKINDAMVNGSVREQNRRRRQESEGKN